MVAVRFVFLICTVSLLPYLSLFPLCTSLRVPPNINAPPEFCQYNGSWCDSPEDTQLQKQVNAVNVSDLHCASLFRAILCAVCPQKHGSYIPVVLSSVEFRKKCDQYSADLLNADTRARIAHLCTSAPSVQSYQSKIDTSIVFCTKLWDTCGNVSIHNPPFVQPAQKVMDCPLSKLTDEWLSKIEFCEDFRESADDERLSFDGEASNRTNESQQPIPGICIEKIGKGSYVSMSAHPDGSDSIFLTSQEGKIWLATVFNYGLNDALNIDESHPFLDITDKVLFQSTYGLLSVAFHPNFNQNGRFFASFTCDKLQHLGCSGRCACNTDANCDPANLGNDKGIMPCQYHNVIAEFSANCTKLTQERSANPSEVRRIFTMGLPSHDGYAGQIIFGPEDGYLYHLVGDESKKDAPYRFSQNKKSVLGKMLRIDVDKFPSTKDRKYSPHLWGNYSIPKDNPWVEDGELLPEIWALGFHNPWRCSFDSDQPSFFLCGDAGQALFEEVDIISKGGNYGWPIYEGPFLHNHTDSSRETNAIKAISPVMGYNDSDVTIKTGAASIIGGYTYRSKTDPCLYGRYLYTDVYANSIWVGTEKPEKSGNYTSKRMAWRCAKDSPLQCDTKPGSHDAAIGYAFSFGEDNRKDVYLLASSGVYRIAEPGRCDFVCAKDKQPSSIREAPIFGSSKIHDRNLKMKIIIHVLLTYAGYLL